MRHIWAAEKQMSSKTSTHTRHTDNTHMHSRTHTCTDSRTHLDTLVHFANTFFCLLADRIDDAFGALTAPVNCCLRLRLLLLRLFSVFRRERTAKAKQIGESCSLVRSSLAISSPALYARSYSLKGSVPS